MTPEPLLLSASWVAGTGLAAGGLAWARVGGVGVRILLVVVSAAGLGAMAATGAGPVVVLGMAGLALVTVSVKAPRTGAMGWAAVAAAALPIAARNGWTVALGEALLLGSITVGLCLGHWFLVDPHLPRGPMRALALGGLAGLVVTAAATAAAPVSLPVIGHLAIPIALVSGTITGIVLAAVLWSLAVPTYKGVQSATGLFYVSTMSVSAFVIVTSALRAVA